LFSHLPLWDFESCDTEGLQARADIVRDGSQIFSSQTRRAAFIEKGAEIFFAFAPICLRVLVCRIIARCEMGRPAAGFLQHLVPIKRQKLVVERWTPWKGVNAIEAEDVINPEDVENSTDPVDAATPPGEAI